MKLLPAKLMCYVLSMFLLFQAMGLHNAPAFAAAVPIDGTTGIPMGGVGAGAIKFSAWQGAFYSADSTPVAYSDWNFVHFSFALVPNTLFQFFSKRGTTIANVNRLSASKDANGKYVDDAVYPLQTANMGTTNGVAINLTAFSPFNTSALKTMTYPYGFFDFKLTNTAASACTVACALQCTTSTRPIAVGGKGFRNSNSTGWERAIYAKSSDAAAIITVGSDNGLFTNGQCNNAINGTLNKTAVKLVLGPNETKNIKFVFSWYCNDAPTMSRYYYRNNAPDAGAVADSGLAFFETLEQSAIAFVDRMRGSNFPEWFKNDLLATLCTFTTNSYYTMDGRYAHAEGMWNLIGTGDQMWHARQLITMMAPDLVFQELSWWARTQRPATDAQAAGQIHHDFEPRKDGGECPWDQWDHPCYVGNGCFNWPDLNCGFIISTYEYFIATDNQQNLTSLWPHVKLAAQRILNQMNQFATAAYPKTFTGSSSSYDIGQQTSDIYNSGLVLAAFKAYLKLCDYQNDTATKATFQTTYATTQASCIKRFLTNNYPTGYLSESGIAGPWISYFLKFGDVFPQSNIDYALGVLNTTYNPVAGMGAPTSSTRHEWGVYVLSHYAGLLLETGHLNEWKGLQLDWWNRNFLNRNMVYNQYLDIPSPQTVYPATDPKSWGTYISIPAIWRNYYTAMGYFRNKHTGELWVEPIVPDSSMNHTITSAPFFSPEGAGTIDYVDSGVVQNITIKSDNPIQVSCLYVRDKFGSTDSGVAVNNVKQPYTRIGTGYAKELKINWTGTVTSTGIAIRVGKLPSTVVRANNPAAVFKAQAPYLTLSVTGVKTALPKSLKGTSSSFTVYDIFGRVVGKTTARDGTIDLKKGCGITAGIYVLKAQL